MLVGLLKCVCILMLGCWAAAAVCQSAAPLSQDNAQQELGGPTKIKRQDIFQSIYALPQFQAKEKKSKTAAMVERIKNLKEKFKVQIQPNMELELSTVKAGPLDVKKSNIIPIHENLQSHEGRFGGDKGYGVEFNYEF